jgi:DNA-binding CsgD family transcriptional regulator
MPAAIMKQPDLLDSIYQAAVVPAEWPEVLDRLAGIADAEGTLLFTAGEQPRWLCSQRVMPIMNDFFGSSWPAHNSRGQRLVPRNEPRFLTDLDAFTPEELDRDPYYTDFLRPRGYGWVVGTTIRAPMSDPVVFSIERLMDRGPVEAEVVRHLDALRPDLARAAVLSAKIGLLTAKTTVDTLQTMGLPAAVLRTSGKVLVTNEAVRALPQLCCRPGDPPLFQDSGSAALFRRHLAGAEPGGGAAGHSFAVPGRGEAAPLVAHLLPICGAGRDVFLDARWILFFTPVRPRAGLSLEILQALYDFTPSEARLLSLLLGGMSLSAAAAASGLSESTSRSYLKTIFAKTNVRRQSELMRLLGASWEPSR